MPLRKAPKTDEVQRNLGNRIRALRSQYGWSQEQFAEVCGLHRTYMGHVERGEKNLSLSTMVRISDALRIGLAQLFLSRKGRPLGKMPNKPSGELSSPRFRFVEIKHIFTELRIERNALKQAVRDLVQLGKNLGGRRPK